MWIYSKILVCFFLILFIFDSCATENSEFIQCANSAGTIPHIAEDGAPEIIPSDSFQICKNKNDYCYTLWQEDPNNGSIEIKSQGKSSLFKNKKLKLFNILWKK